MTITKEMKKQWLQNYKTAPDQLTKMSQINGLISAFNANIDAVIKISGKAIEKLIQDFKIDEKEILSEKTTTINTKEDALRGLLKCFTKGIAEEWLIEDKEVFQWLQNGHRCNSPARPSPDPLRKGLAGCHGKQPGSTRPRPGRES